MCAFDNLFFMTYTQKEWMTQHTQDMKLYLDTWNAFGQAAMEYCFFRIFAEYLFVQWQNICWLYINGNTTTKTECEHNYSVISMIPRAIFL